MKDLLIIDAHVHLWDELRGDLHGKSVRHLGNGRVDFGGTEKQMMPPYMISGANTSEMLLANMEYAGVSSAVVTQEYIDGLQNDYLEKVSLKSKDKFFMMGMAEFRRSGYLDDVKRLVKKGFQGIKIPAEKLIVEGKLISLMGNEMIELFQYMEENKLILSIDLAEGDTQVKEMEKIIELHPKLKIAIGHFGMVNRPLWKKQIELAKNKNVYIESGGITWLFHKEFYPYSRAVKAIKEAIDIVGEDKLMWGSDYPRTMTEITYKMSYDFIIKSEELSERFKKKFLGETAKEFYSLKNISKIQKTPSILED